MDMKKQLAALGSALGMAIHQGFKEFPDHQIIGRIPRHAPKGKGRGKQPHRPTGIAKSRRAVRKRKNARG